MMEIGSEALVRLVAERVGEADVGAVARAIARTVEALASALPAADAAALADDLPAPFDAAARAGAAAPIAPGADPFAALTQGRARPAVAIEYAHVVAQLLAAHVGPTARALLARHLPAPWRELFAPREVDPAPAPVHRAPPVGAGHTLATGRPPAARHPISASAPAPQPGSIAAAPDPDARAAPADGDTLSRATPHGEAIATAKPSGARHLSERDG